MTRFILSHHKLAFPHILQHQLCIKIPHLPFWALAAVAKSAKEIFLLCRWRFWLLLCYTKSGIINSATFCFFFFFTVCLWPLRVKLLSEWEVIWRVKVCLLCVMLSSVLAVLSFHSFTSAVIECFCLQSHFCNLRCRRVQYVHISCAWCVLTRKHSPRHQNQVVWDGEKNHVVLFHKKVFYMDEMRYMKWHVNLLSELTKEVICHQTTLGRHKGNSLWQHPVLNFTDSQQ